MALAEDILAGDRLALARLVTLIENGDEAGRQALNQLYPHTGNAHIIGLTGGTGTGKSTLVNQLARHLRQVGLRRLGAEPQPVTVGVVAVDPTSPFTGGAILGDRIRMGDLAGDQGVFIRSMASRGALGGLAAQTRPVVQAMDAAGFEIILVETVGAGQSEVEIVRTAHTTIVIDAPGLGDEVQALKAGILEIADILVVNKVDLPGAKRAIAALRTALRFGGPTAASEGNEWETPLLETVATEGRGIPELAAVVAEHRDFLESSGHFHERERRRVEREVENLVQRRLVDRFFANQRDGAYQSILDRVQRRELSPEQAVSMLMEAADS